ncbi:MAG: T9SS type A sorting domain-containing protein [Flavobacteriales bacterium]|nr:T9SS type A sorting domain-containing protein [Flavobacteriales bacterium]
MRYIFCSILILFASLREIRAQESINASGSELSGSTGTISYSIGQVVYHTNSLPGGSMAEGVQQPYEISTVLGIDIPEIVLQLSAYPNPTTDVLNLVIGNYNYEDLSYQLYDVAGKLLLDGNIVDSSTAIRMDQFAMATYYLTIADSQKPIKTFKIIKT